MVTHRCPARVAVHGVILWPLGGNAGQRPHKLVHHMQDDKSFLSAIGSVPWLIEASWLDTICSMATRLNESTEAVSALLGQHMANTRTVEQYGATALIPIRGPIFRYDSALTRFFGATSLEVLARDFQAALDNPAIDKIVLHLDTPGGQASGIAEFADHIANATLTKPVTAYVCDLAASAGYWLASHAGEIVVSPTAMLGSIGVVMTYAPQGKNSPIEIISAQSPLKRSRPDTETGKAEAQRLVDELAAVFVARVATARYQTVDHVLTKFGAGGLLVGQSAVTARMADRIGTLDALLGGKGPATPSRMAAAEEPGDVWAEVLRPDPQAIAAKAGLHQVWNAVLPPRS